jgi:hypothetical protein
MTAYRIELATVESIIIHALDIKEAERLGRSVSDGQRNCKLHAVIDIDQEAALAAKVKSA